LNQAAGLVQAEPFVRVLARMFGGRARDAAIGIPRVPLDQLYAEPAADWLSRRGSEVRTRARAQILCNGQSVTGIDVDGQQIAARHVVCAVPWHAVGTTLGSPPVPALARVLEGAAAMTSSPIVTVNLWLDRAITEVPYLGLPGRVMQWVFDKRHAFGERASHLSLVSSGAAEIVERANDELIELAVHELREAIPAARVAQLVRAIVVREKRATFSLAPGQPPRPGAVTSVRGLVLAGDWTDTGLPATIESAVVSGHRAAGLVVTG
jgi:hydroxysqualene dehydroxylase